MKTSLKLLGLQRSWTTLGPAQVRWQELSSEVTRTHLCACFSLAGHTTVCENRAMYVQNRSHLTGDWPWFCSSVFKILKSLVSSYLAPQRKVRFHFVALDSAPFIMFAMDFMPCQPRRGDIYAQCRMHKVYSNDMFQGIFAGKDSTNCTELYSCQT